MQLSIYTHSFKIHTGVIPIPPYLVSSESATLANVIIIVSSLKADPTTSAFVSAANGMRTSRMKHSRPHSHSSCCSMSKYGGIGSTSCLYRVDISGVASGWAREMYARERSTKLLNTFACDYIDALHAYMFSRWISASQGLKYVGQRATTSIIA